MDLVSSYSVQIRNRCKIVSPINIMQFNRDSGNQERMKQNLMDPTSNDFKDSGAINFICRIKTPLNKETPNIKLRTILC